MPTDLTEARVDAPVGSIQVYRGGAGPQLVYLHSAGGETPFELLTDLADDFDVIAPVFPGFGESEGIEAIDTMEDAVFHLLDLWERLELSQPVVMGVSLGGWMALELSTRYPDHARALVLINAVGLYLEDAPIAELFGRPPNELAEMLFADQSHPIAQAMHSMAEFVGDVGIKMEIPLELVVPMWKALGATARLGWDPYMHSPKLRGRLRRVTCPVLVVAGEQDGFVPIEHARVYAAELPDARLELMADGAHWLHMELPAELAALTRGFLGA
ncbi:MAG: alpha/beta hydrolase [Acidimicrobiia bacterium]